jgi:ASC-1-like (ASCH) protein
MCAYYEDKITKIKKNDKAIYQGTTIEIISVKHIKSNKTMDIKYKTVGRTALCPTTINIPYHAYVKDLVTHA